MGSSSSDPPPVDQTPQTIPSITNWQGAPGVAVSDFITPLIGQGIPHFEGPVSAGPNALQTQAQGILSQYGSAQNPLLQQAQNPLAFALSGQSSSNINPQATQDFFQRSIYNPAQQNLTRNILPQIGAAYAGPGGGFWSSARAGAQGQAINDFAGRMEGAGAQLAYQDEQARRALAESAAGRSLQAVPLAQQLSQEPAQRAQSLMAGGGIMQAIEDLGIRRELERFRAESPENAPYIQQAMQLMGIPTLSAYQRFAPPEAQGGGFNLGMGLGGGLASGLGAAAIGITNPWALAALAGTGMLAGGLS